eukprot:2320094-Rhodomonas_salina.2
MSVQTGLRSRRNQRRTAAKFVQSVLRLRAKAFDSTCRASPATRCTDSRTREPLVAPYARSVPDIA